MEVVAPRHLQMEVTAVEEGLDPPINMRAMTRGMAREAVGAPVAVAAALLQEVRFPGETVAMAGNLGCLSIERKAAERRTLSMTYSE